MALSANQKIKELGIEKREMTVWLKFETGATTFWCPYCRSGLIKYQGRIIAIMYGEGVIEPFVSPPISVQCKSCGTVFHISGMNE